MSAWITLSPLLCVGFGGLALMVLDAFARDKRQMPAVTSLVLLVSGCLAGMLWYGDHVGPAPEPIAPYLALDAMAQFFHIIICAGTLLSALLAGGYTREHALERGELYPILLFTAFGAMVLAAATDLLTIFIGLETMSLGVYCLVAFRQGSHRSAEAAIKYFLLGSFAAALLLFGSALLYGATGHTDLAGIGEAVTNGTAILPFVLLGLVLVAAGLAFKVSAVPFHMWTPDAYEGAITPVTAFMSVAVKAAAFATLLRVLLIGFGDALSSNAATGWPAALALLAAITMLWGNFAAAQQSSVKRMLAYSSIAHAGYILIGVVAMHGARELAVSAVLYYLAAYTVSNALAFGSLILMGSYHREAVSYDDLLGVGRRHPAVGLSMTLAVLSLMGFPPTAGFFGKWYVFSAALSAGDQYVWLVVLGGLTSVVAAYYYLRVVVVMFMRAPEEDKPIAVPMRSGYVVAALVLAAYFVLKMGITPSSYIEMARAAARPFA
jgi:NADH-quinone oxidoreductase subunit N